MSFKEFLEDYEAKEKEGEENFLKRYREGKVSQNERYPAKKRYIKLKEPIAFPGGDASNIVNIWGIIPFYGSTIIPLCSRDNKKDFDEICQCYGFNSRLLDKMIDLVKETGRLQFGISDNPTQFKNLEFLEPLFRELKPPIIAYNTAIMMIGDELEKKYSIEFETLSKFGFTDGIKMAPSRIMDQYTGQIILGSCERTYIVIKALGYDELADEIGTLMITDFAKAFTYFRVFDSLIANPKTNISKPIYNFNRELLTTGQEFGKAYGFDINEKIPYEIGRFLLNKIVLYPETLDGCMNVIQEYDDYGLYKVLGALDEGVKRKKIDAIEDKKLNMSEILDNVWKDADKIKLGSEGISFGVSLDIGLIGELAAGLPGAGLLAALGFQAMDRFWGETGESMSEKIAKFVSPNYLVAVYDFKKQHALTD